MDRITRKHLDSIVDRINSVLDMPETPYATIRDDRCGLVANAGNYHLDMVYGGYRLVRMCEGGGTRDMSPRGTKRETYEYCRAFLDGISAATGA
jgi:hypothetical protein